MRKHLLVLLCLCIAISQLMAQNRTVTGKIIDDKGNPVPNATVLLKGAKRNSGTATSSDGTFSLSVPPDGKSLLVSALNFLPQEISIGDKSIFNFSLRPSTTSLDEVVVVGYGTQKKASSTASIVRVSGDKLENKPFTSVDEMLQGASAGLQSTATTGQPGANQPIRIRGIDPVSYRASKPLYVSDGIQLNASARAN